jgi:hypothetical protein
MMLDFFAFPPMFFSLGNLQGFQIASVVVNKLYCILDFIRRLAVDQHTHE